MVLGDVTIRHPGLAEVRARAGRAPSSSASHPPEEVSTFNLARRLCFWNPNAVVLHSRPLEGGNRRLGRRPSGVDLELAIEAQPNRWFDLALQAKRLDPVGRYRGWDPIQNSNLVRWATRHRRTPGMLLYDWEIPPFGPPQTSVDLGGCCSSPLRCHGWRWPQWVPPDDRSPTAVTIVLFNRGMSDPLLSMTGPTATAISKRAAPLECLTCPGFGGQSSSEGPPPWAEQLLDGSTSSVDSEGPAYSIVLPYTEG